MNILTAPFFSLFSVNFYRQVLRSPLSRGFLYLAYLSALAIILILLFFTLRVFPQVDGFVNWAKSEMPTLLWTDGRLVMNAENPQTMRHPEFGPLVTIDTSQTDVTTDQIGQTVIFLTSNKVYVKEGEHQVRVYDLANLVKQYREENGGESPRDVTLNGDFVEKIYRSVKPVIVFVVLLFAFPLFFIANLLMALIGSGIGALINLSRTERLPYSTVLNVTLFALTASFWIYFLQLLIPFLDRIPFGFWGGLLVTGIYLFVALKISERDSGFSEFSPPEAEPPKAA